MRGTDREKDDMRKYFLPSKETLSYAIILTIHGGPLYSHQTNPSITPRSPALIPATSF